MNRREREAEIMSALERVLEHLLATSPVGAAAAADLADDEKALADQVAARAKGRREYLAISCLNGLLAGDHRGTPPLELAALAVRHADALTATLAGGSR